MSNPSIGAAVGGSHEIRSSSGKVFRAKLIDQDLKAEWERRQLDREVQLARGMRPLRTDEEHGKELKRIQDKYLSGGYALLNSEGLAAFKQFAEAKNIQPVLQLCSLLFSCEENDLIGLMVDRQEELLSMVVLIIRESFPGIVIGDVAGVSDPNAQVAA